LKLGPVAVKALKVATKLALETPERMDEDTRAIVRELYCRAADALENWTYDPKTETWSVGDADGSCPECATDMCKHATGIA
jgi:hypothetical protein